MKRKAGDTGRAEGVKQLAQLGDLFGKILNESIAFVSNRGFASPGEAYGYIQSTVTSLSLSFADLAMDEIDVDYAIEHIDILIRHATAFRIQLEGYREAPESSEAPSESD